MTVIGKLIISFIRTLVHNYKYFHLLLLVKYSLKLLAFEPEEIKIRMNFQDPSIISQEGIHKTQIRLNHTKIVT